MASGASVTKMENTEKDFGITVQGNNKFNKLKGTLNMIS